MKRKQISNMTEEEAMDELTFMAIKSLLQKAKKKCMAYEEAEQAVFDALDDMCIDSENVISNAENASNLKQAITCWLNYDEYNLRGIMKEIREAYGKED